MEPNKIEPQATSNKMVLTIIISAAVAALAAGGGVYAYQKNQNVISQANLQTQINTLKSQIALASPSAVLATPTPTPPVPTPSLSTSSAVAQSTQTPTPLSGKKINSTSPFDVTSIKAGDEIGNMTVVSINPIDASRGPLSNNNAIVTFSGEQEISGTFTNNCGGADGCATVISATNLDNVSMSWLPKINNKTGTNYSAFQMQDALAVNAFPKGRWNADLIINNFAIYSSPAGTGGPGDVTSHANLVKVNRKNTYYS